MVCHFFGGFFLECVVVCFCVSRFVLFVVCLVVLSFYHSMVLLFLFRVLFC